MNFAPNCILRVPQVRLGVRKTVHLTRHSLAPLQNVVEVDILNCVPMTSSMFVRLEVMNAWMMHWKFARSVSLILLFAGGSYVAVRDGAEGIRSNLRK